MSSNSIRDTFFEECEDLLEALVEGLEQMLDGHHDGETVNAVFRAVHSMKGGAGAFGLEALVNFAHRFETVLDRIRSNELTVDDNVMRILQRAGDQIAVLVEMSRDGEEIDESQSAGLIADLDGLIGSSAGPESDAPAPEAEFSFEAMTIDIPGEDSDPSLQVFTITFKPLPDLFKNGHEPAFLFSALAELGKLETTVDIAELPDLDQIEPEVCYLSWTFVLETSESEEAIHEVFEFVEGLCELDVREGNSASVPVAPEIVATADAAAAADVANAAAPRPAEKTAAPEKATEQSAHKTTLRVDLDRVDRLINTVGELIINQSMIDQRIGLLDLSSSSDIENDLDEYKRLARDIQDAVMSIRAQPVKPLFQRMSRIVREATDATGKNARLLFEGENTEVDKTLIERLSDPLTHMIRNAVDHGIESVEQRREAGKDEVGRIVLSAAQQSGTVLIKVRDDGAGLNRDKIKEIAITKGLIPADAELSENEIDNLLFLPGFSTASQVSNLSGRGVGMDVVKNAIAGLGGRVSISSIPGNGTTFTIVLPLTLAVMDGMVVSVAGETIVVPIASVVETIRPTPRDMHQIGPSEYLLSIRGSFVPVIDVADRLGFGTEESEESRSVCLLVDTQTKGYCAFAVDAIFDQRQVVVKGLGEAYGDIPGVSAATILGDGKIALILDPSNLVATTEGVPASEMGSIAFKETLHADAR